MKAVLYLAILAFAVSCALACNNDGTNEPVCDSSNVGQTFRNFEDPTAYWQCNSAGAPAVLMRCSIGNNMYDSAAKKCISSDDWQWTPNCPE